MKNRKIIGYSVIGLIFSAMVFAGVFVLGSSTDTDTSAQKEVARNVKTDPDLKIEGVMNVTGLDSGADQERIIVVMHKMTHQKVIADDKWGAIPMTKSTIQEVYDIVDGTDIALKQELLTILTAWKEGRFDNIVQDHNYLWKIAGGDLGKAYGIMSKTQEMRYAATNFEEEVAAVIYEELGFRL
ncbi:DUF6241 domain-containing protein [Domibacillus sp. A3M-37]|uniref:DUF6241 domain-containing protein n=1 Tax=Domibacillus sp. A3M-37 TaxID=2962037 RepID=UPI0020B6D5F5|nr:DUF6241 domain-containing protein [Domibacillus sp. A3M-37]MCP3764571.1 DUF6241 domain-containing protein [Domibacillus sp. A3M-37]